MDNRPAPSLAEQYAAAVDWWAEAGVDLLFVDEAASMLAEAEAAAEPAKQAPRPKPKPEPEVLRPMIGGAAESWPATLADFANWWLAEPTLDEGGIAPRVAPRGVAQPDLMVLVPMPEAGDGESLLSGMQGQLVANMLRAMGIAADRAYVASALPRHMPHADWDALAANGLGAVLLHHVGLVAPRRLLVLGRSVLPLLGQEMRRGVAHLPLNGGNLPLLASLAPENLLENARYRADLWRRWLDWTSNA